MIRNEYERSTSEYDREKLQERLARLAGGVAIIRVGAATETEMKEKKLRIEDALNATRAAVEEGIVAGGGTAYVNAIAEVEKLIDQVEGDEKTGVQIIARALTAPLRHPGEGQEQRHRRVWLRCLQGSVLRHDLQRDCGPHQGDPFRPGERCLHFLHAADHRGSGGRPSGSPLCHRRRCPRSRYERRYVLIPTERRWAAPLQRRTEDSVRLCHVREKDFQTLSLVL